MKLFIFLFSLSSSLSFSQSDFEKLYLAGKNHYYQQAYNNALEDFQEAEKIDDKHIDLKFFIGATFFHLKQWDFSQTYLNEVINLAPHYKGAYLILANSYTIRNKYKRAIKILKQWHRQSSDDKSDTYYQIARNYYLLGTGYQKQALSNIESAITQSSRFKEAYILKAQILYAIKFSNLDSSLKILDKAILIDPDFTLSHVTKADLLASNWKFSLAEKTLKDSLAYQVDKTLIYDRLIKVKELQKIIRHWEVEFNYNLSDFKEDHLEDWNQFYLSTIYTLDPHTKFYTSLIRTNRFNNYDQILRAEVLKRFRTWFYIHAEMKFNTHINFKESYMARLGSSFVTNPLKKIGGTGTVARIDVERRYFQNAPNVDFINLTLEQYFTDNLVIAGKLFNVFTIDERYSVWFIKTTYRPTKYLSIYAAYGSVVEDIVNSVYIKGTFKEAGVIFHPTRDLDVLLGYNVSQTNKFEMRRYEIKARYRFNTRKKN